MSSVSFKSLPFAAIIAAGFTQKISKESSEPAEEKMDVGKMLDGMSDEELLRLQQDISNRLLSDGYTIHMTAEKK